jgi:L-arabinose isomerase
MERTNRPKPRIGYFGSSLAAYWPQFPHVKEIVLDTMERHVTRIETMGCDVVRGGIVDRAEKGIEVGELFARESLDLIIGELMTYTASHVLVPIAQLDTETFTPATGPMTAPEVSCAFNRSGLPFHFVVGGDFQESVWTEVQEWVEAATTKKALMNSRLGYLGHYYPGMLDMYTDFTMHQGFLGAYVEILEMCDLADRVHNVTEGEIEKKVEEAKQTFLMPPPGYDRITAKVEEDELRWAARVACAEDKLITDFALDGLAYYYRGWNNNEYERIAAGMILGNSLATARGIPCAGEADLKTCVAMFIMDHFNAGGSFCELYFFDYEGDFVIVGHDGPGHIAIGDKKPILRGMKLFHGKAGHGVSVEFNIRHGPVTLLGLTQTGDGKFKFVAAQGESIPGKIFQIGNTNTRVRFGNMRPDTFARAWIETGSTHHFALGVGHQLGKIEKLAKLLGFELAVVAT